MSIRRALTKGQKAAILNPSSAQVLVESMNAERATQKIEIEALRANYADLQNKYEASRKQFYKADKANGILASKLQFSLVTEITKYALTAIGTGYGINVVTSGNKAGWLYVGVSGLLYTVIVEWQSRSLKS